MNDLSAAERCVKCGLCLAHCPTFDLTGNEADSPRGRISLMQLLDTPQPEYSPGLFKHLDSCLLCRACEAMCPSQVPFGQLMDTAREKLEKRRKHPRLHRWLKTFGLALLTSSNGRLVSRLLVSVGRNVFLQRLARQDVLPGKLSRLLRHLPDAGTSSFTRPRALEQAGTAEARAPASRPLDVNLFLGCSGELLDEQTLEASRKLLQRLGYRVASPARQTCCGALHQHSGQSEQALRLARANLNAFAANDNPILTFATGCQSQLYKDWPNEPGAGAFSARVHDIIDYLASHSLERLNFKPLDESVALYIPCSHRNVIKTHKTLTRVLTRIPQLRVLYLNPEGGCCGAAGSYMLEQPDYSDRLADRLVDAVMESGVSRLLTTNIGCALHLSAGLKRHDAAVDVMHPVVLLEHLLEVG